MFYFSTVTYDMKRTYDASTLEKLSDQDKDTCILLKSYPEIPPIRVKYSMQIWPSENVSLWVILHHSQVTLNPASWLRAYSRTFDNDPEPVSGIVVWQMCELVQSTGYVTDMNCTCTFPCLIVVEISFLFQSDVTVCKIGLYQMPADGLSVLP